MCLIHAEIDACGAASVQRSVELVKRLEEAKFGDGILFRAGQAAAGAPCRGAKRVLFHEDLQRENRPAVGREQVGVFAAPFAGGGGGEAFKKKVMVEETRN